MRKSTNKYGFIWWNGKFRHIAHTTLAEFNMYTPPEMVNIVIIWRFSVYIFRQINSFLYLCDEIAIKEVWTH